MNETILQRIGAFLFGHKYYANIINTRGTGMIEMSSFIFTTPEEAERHREELQYNRSFLFIETITFRSRKVYPQGCSMIKR